VHCSQRRDKAFAAAALVVAVAMGAPEPVDPVKPPVNYAMKWKSFVLGLIQKFRAIGEDFANNGWDVLYIICILFVKYFSTLQTAADNIAKVADVAYSL